VFVDLDGTLVHETDDVSPRVIQALQSAQEAGCTIVICTGRSRFEVEPVAAQWGGHGYLITNNGAVISEWETGRILHKVVLPMHAVRQAAQIAHYHGMTLLCIEVEEQNVPQRIFTDRKFPLPASFLEEHGQRLHEVDDIRKGVDRDLLTVMVFGSQEETEAVYTDLIGHLGPEVSVFHAPFNRLATWCTYLTPSDANKATAARTVAEILNVAREDTLAIGDHLNDLELLMWSGTGIAMGDGHPLAKAQADHVTGTFEEDGAAEAIERFVIARLDGLKA
jgi:Cof subfamily protein (haloacid dehalogenase superfamily)